MAGGGGGGRVASHCSEAEGFGVSQIMSEGSLGIQCRNLSKSYYCHFLHIIVDAGTFRLWQESLGLF